MICRRTLCYPDFLLCISVLQTGHWINHSTMRIQYGTCEFSTPNKLPRTVHRKNKQIVNSHSSQNQRYITVANRKRKQRRKTRHPLQQSDHQRPTPKRNNHPAVNTRQRMNLPWTYQPCRQISHRTSGAL